MKNELFHTEGISYINPLFWQRGEAEETLREEIRKMKSVGIGEFIAEARPHPHYLEEEWWRDLAILIDEAKKNQMRMWIFDDGHYPSGKANGLLAELHPEALKQYIACCYIDATGPLDGAYFLVENFLREKESILRLIAAKRKDRNTEILPETLTDITDRLQNGRLYWDLPDGDWRIFMIKGTPYGDEEHTSGHVNPLSKEAVRTYIDLIHEAHWAHFKQEFGKTIAGFFTDEPRFGNAIGYDRIIGSSFMPLPYTEGLLEELSGKGMGDFGKLLPCLWVGAGDVSAGARCLYMDAVSRRFGENFIGQLGEWCHDHDVQLIGHVVEENGAHARLGYGAGHYFRSTAGLDAGGLDIVCNMLPEQTSGCYLTAFNNYDCDFNHWGLPKMASSASHIDPKKQGRTMVEAFGAYGWAEGLKWMKWITDALAVRGVNYFVPHAFSAAPFPDDDCPPHFYAHGYNPQFRNFGVWSGYANRVCHLISGGLHIAPVAVVYHGEAEWGGKCQPFEKVVKTLMQHQIDCDVVPFDALEDQNLTKVRNAELQINEETYKAVLLPEMEYITPEALACLKKFEAAGVPVLWMNHYPEKEYFNGTTDCSQFPCVKMEELPEYLHSQGWYDIAGDRNYPDLCYYHYQKNGTQLYFFVNQSTKKEIDCEITFPVQGTVYLYDAMLNKKYTVAQEAMKEGTKVHLYLEPYQSMFVLFGEASGLEERVLGKNMSQEEKLEGTWKISTATAEEYPEFRPVPLNCLGNAAAPELLPEFSGTIRYELTFDAAADSRAILDLGKVYEIANVTLNGVDLGARICPPYQYVLPENLLKPTDNVLVAEITNTLAKSSAHPFYDRYFAQEPSGLIGPVRILY